MAKNGVLKETLDNGLKVIVKEMHHAPVATWWVWYRVGSRNELPGITGASHWVEHMLFKGTPSYPAGVLDKTISRDGGRWNAMTWIDWTAYFETMPASRIELAIDLEADRMVNSIFDPDEIESERTVILSERSGSENQPTWLLYEELLGAAFRVHPYHHSVIGHRVDLETMSRQDLYDHYKRFYVPNNATAVLVGDVDAKAILDLVAEKYGAIPAGEQPAEVKSHEPAQYGERRLTVNREGTTAYVMVAYRAPAIGDPDFFPLVVLDSILSGPSSFNSFGGGGTSNKTSRLYKALVETELAAGIGGGVTATIDPYLYSIHATVRTGGTPQQVEEAIDAELRRVASESVTKAEFEKARKQAKALFAFSSESVTNQGMWLGMAETLIGDYTWFETYLDQLMAVTLDDVSRVAAQVLDPHRRTVGWYVPTGTPEA